MHAHYNVREEKNGLLQRFATYWTLRGSKSSVGEIFRISTDGKRDPHSLLYSGHHVSFPGVKWPESGVDHPSVLGIQVKKLSSFTANFLPRIHGEFRGWTPPLRLPLVLKLKYSAIKLYRVQIWYLYESQYECYNIALFPVSCINRLVVYGRAGFFFFGIQLHY